MRRHPLTLLRLCRDRPCRRRPAEQRDEVAALHGRTLNPKVTPYHIAKRNAALCITAKLIGEWQNGSNSPGPIYARTSASANCGHPAALAGGSDVPFAALSSAATSVS
jgi:hypothetical protein